MIGKLTGKNLQFYETIDRILWENWDPIGINDSNARDEYYGYLPKVYRLSLEEDQKGILEYLLFVERERMGMKGDEEHCEKVASLVMLAKKDIGVC